MDAELFAKSVAIGLAVAAPVGPMSLLCIRSTLRDGRGAGLLYGAGIAAADATYAAVAALGVAAVAAVLASAGVWLKLIGSLVLVCFGAMTFLAPPANRAEDAPARTGVRGLCSAYALTLTNPPTFLFFAGVFASLSAFASTVHAALFAGGVFAGSLLWWLLLTSVVSVLAVRLNERLFVLFNRIAGATLTAFGLRELARLAGSA